MTDLQTAGLTIEQRLERARQELVSKGYRDGVVHLSYSTRCSLLSERWMASFYRDSSRRSYVVGSSCQTTGEALDNLDMIVSALEPLWSESMIKRTLGVAA